MLWVALHFQKLPAGMLESIAAWTCRFTPKVSLEPPCALLAEVQGSLRLLGGLGNLLEALHGGIAEMGVEASLAVASTPRAALWRARGAGRPLDALPLSVMDADLELFRSIGVSTIGELRRLPRNGLARRCSERLLADLDRALGVLPEPRHFFAPPPRFSAEIELPAEATEAEALIFAARRLLVQLEGLLAARQAGVRGFALTLFHHREERKRIEVRFASVTREVERFVQLLRERLPISSLKSPVEKLKLEAEDFVPLHERSAGMFGDAAAKEEGWARLLERLRARLGREAACGLATHPDHRPEYAWQRVEPGEWDPRQPPATGPRPLWLVEPARRVEEAEFELLAGPERIESGWWDGDDARRDYFIARDPGASLVWIYREAGEWFMHGIFA